MKKTLTFLFALAGIASANSVVVEPAGLTLKMTEDSIAWVDASTSTVVKSLTSSSATTADGYFTTNGTNQIGDRFGWGNTSTNGMEMITFTLTLTADWTANASGASMLLAWGEGDEWGFGFGVGEDGNWTVVKGGYSAPVTITTSGVAAVDGGAQEYTIIGRMEIIEVPDPDYYGYASPKGIYHIQAYEGETLVFSGSYGSTDSMIQFGQGYNPYIGFGAGLNGDNATVMTVSNATLYIPEPATATLSLLALCGLAARRRRK